MPVCRLPGGGKQLIDKAHAYAQLPRTLDGKMALVPVNEDAVQFGLAHLRRTKHVVKAHNIYRSHAWQLRKKLPDQRAVLVVSSHGNATRISIGTDKQFAAGF